ncbi:unnamed protein product [Didymodactylos carnosus]|uniref:NAD(P)(+)--arginine ADP-ribosyltransferase n=1 Tax=Didymodactylos carnosus TaxID=1234261 RepID=A0A814TFJ2_9BILA|nr:unnamed protein product [Didymodactylos carnosus]CAF3924250.1 unnamed protein product [Didymodactylos carnosus]
MENKVPRNRESAAEEATYDESVSVEFIARRATMILLDCEKNEQTKEFAEFLRKMFDYVQSYDTLVTCIENVEKLQSEYVFLVLSHSINQHDASTIENLQQIKFIYALSMNNDVSWITNILQSFDTQEDLVSQLHKDISPYRQVPFPINTLSVTDKEKTAYELGNDTQKYIWYYLLIEILNRMPESDINDAKRNMIAMCEKELKLNECEKATLNEFNNTYHPKKAIFWYSKDSFIYRKLNKALRTQNITQIFNFRFIIADIRKQLATLHSEQCRHNPRDLITYRGQIMQEKDFNKLKEKCGKRMSVYQFFSTTMDRQMALCFMQGALTREYNVRVLFIIKANTRNVSSQPFAEISSVSMYPGEYEVLFALDAVFRIAHLEKKDGYWQIHLILDDKREDEEVERILEGLKNRLGDVSSFLTFGDFLIDLGQYDNARKYCELMLAKLPPGDYERAMVYNNIGKYYLSIGDYDSARDRFQLAFKINSLHFKKRESPTTVSSELATKIQKAPALTCFNLGCVYFRLGDYDTALHYFVQALSIWKHCSPVDEVELAKTYSYIALAQKGTGNKAEGLKTAMKAIKVASAEHLVRGWALLSQAACSPLAHAENLYVHALQIFELFLPPDHPDLVFAHLQMSKLYRQKENFSEALRHDEQALKICNMRPENAKNRADFKLCKEYMRLDKNPPVRKYSL